MSLLEKVTQKRKDIQNQKQLEEENKLKEYNDTIVFKVDRHLAELEKMMLACDQLTEDGYEIILTNPKTKPGYSENSLDFIPGYIEVSKENLKFYISIEDYEEWKEWHDPDYPDHYILYYYYVFHTDKNFLRHDNNFNVIKRIRIKDVKTPEDCEQILIDLWLEKGWN